jgi:hypothetical protein
MSSNEWHYMRDDQQVGPISGAQLRQLANTGQLRPTDLVWKEGMAEWSPASRVKGLFGVPNPATPAAAAAPASARPVAAAARSPVMPTAAAAPATATATPAAQPSSEIAYYNPTAGMPARVAQTLKGFPPLRGPRLEWPLSDAHLTQLALAEKQRKALRGFNSLCQLLTLVYALVSIAFAVFLFAAGSGPRLFRGEPTVILAAILGVSIAFTALFYLAGKAALKCRIWGPITVTALFGLSALWTLGSVVFGFGNAPAADSLGGVIGLAIVILFYAAFLTVSIRAILAIPRFLACPVWAQEALVNAKL